MDDVMRIVNRAMVDQLVQKKQPEWIKPMLATLSHDPFSDENWLYERKLDGERCLVFKDKGKLELMSRNRKNLNVKYPEIVEAFEAMSTDHLIVDGEIVAFDGNLTSFSALQERMHLETEDRVRESEVKVFYYAFDLLYYDSYDLTHLPLRERKKLLKKLLDYEDPIRYTIHWNEEGLAYLKTACSRGWEGIMAKRADSRYVQSRSKQWLKFKCEKSQEFVVVGYTAPQGERMGFGALLLAYYDQGMLTFAGKVGTGFSDAMLSTLGERLQRLKVDRSPFDSESSKESVRWVEPSLVVEVRFTEWTDEGKLRHPSFKGLREDKTPREVTREGSR